MDDKNYRYKGYEENPKQVSDFHKKKWEEVAQEFEKGGIRDIFKIFSKETIKKYKKELLMIAYFTDGNLYCVRNLESLFKKYLQHFVEIAKYDPSMFYLLDVNSRGGDASVLN